MPVSKSEYRKALERGIIEAQVRAELNRHLIRWIDNGLEVETIQHSGYPVWEPIFSYVCGYLGDHARCIDHDTCECDCHPEKFSLGVAPVAGGE